MKVSFECVDGHTAGMPVRMVVSGAPDLQGADQSERRQHFIHEFDWIRRALMFEPRGHSAMSGSIIYPPSSDDFDMGVIYIETTGSLPMCGHGTIGTATFALERGLVTPKVEGLLRLETPAGRVDVQYVRDGDKVTTAKLINVPSFLMYRDVEIESSDLGLLKVDIAYGGNFYPIIERQEHFNDINDFDASSLIQMGIRLRETIEDTCDITHPLDASISGLRHCMWTGEPMDMSSDARGCVIAGEMIDRSPCGTGTSARLAQRVAKGLLDIGAPFVHESYIGSVFTGTAEEKTAVGEYDAIIPGISGSAHITGLNTIYVDSSDPFPEGFVI
tara:strand:- start:730 stop:1722 length:993 start_codon:yes stop_codon:yes gene_type:complete